MAKGKIVDDPSALTRRAVENGSGLYTLDDGSNTMRQNDFEGYTPTYETTPTVPTTETKKDDGSTTTSGGGGGTSATSIYQNYLEQILADQKAASDARQQALTENYNRALATLQQNHNQQVNSLQQNADDSLRQAYINYMLNQKGINQTLANQGINGGATESILANLYNNYGSNRNTIAKELQNGLADLGASYNSNVSDLANSYGSNLADVLADYYNSAASTKENYANKIASALASATSSKNSSSTSSNANATSTEYRPNGLSDGVWNGVKNVMSRYLNGDVDGDYLKSYMSGVMNDTDMYNVLYENGINPSYLGLGNNPINNNDEDVQNSGSGVKMDGTNYARSGYDYDSALADLKRIRGMSANSSDLQNAVNSYLNNLMSLYGISQDEAKKLFNAAGF